MKIAILKERAEHESRVAATPDTVKKYVEMGASVTVEQGAGLASAIRDAEFEKAGAQIAPSADVALDGADLVLAVQTPKAEQLVKIPAGATLVGMLNPLGDPAGRGQFAQVGISAYAMELIPRISRAQSMDALSSQANLAGYRAVIEAAQAFGKAFPMMMTAAGTIPPAKVVVVGAGVAGLQAIATAKRLGAVVSAFDVRPAVKEQVESLGASFVEVPGLESGEGKGGYAKELSEADKAKQAEALHEHLKKQDIVITTALIPGRPAPVLVTEAMVRDMKEGAVIVDLAAANGGNCPLTEKDKLVQKHGVTLIGHTNLPSRVAADASRLYAKNILNFLMLMWDKENRRLNFDVNDEIVKAAKL